jgi:hypothetical protein
LVAAPDLVGPTYVVWTSAARVKTSSPAIAAVTTIDQQSLLDRVNTAVNGLTTTAPPTATHRESLAIAQQ